MEELDTRNRDDVKMFRESITALMAVIGNILLPNHFHFFPVTMGQSNSMENCCCCTNWQSCTFGLQFTPWWGDKSVLNLPLYFLFMPYNVSSIDTMHTFHYTSLLFSILLYLLVQYSYDCYLFYKKFHLMEMETLGNSIRLCKKGSRFSSYLNLKGLCSEKNRY